MLPVLNETTKARTQDTTMQTAAASSHWDICTDLAAMKVSVFIVGTYRDKGLLTVSSASSAWSLCDAIFLTRRSLRIRRSRPRCCLRLRFATYLLIRFLFLVMNPIIIMILPICTGC